ncbi:DUF2889 domain-containing protein [Rhodocista pekingensis]|uniref:DUF2889 domain-containing protein n=1 Tax=Rhodocista pekingensis TaxID=201185 RepID=A0ABW2KRR3_9PROT
MPLSPPAEREPIHTRTVTCRGYRRTDGLWDIEGHLVDTKSYAFDNAWRGRLEPGMPVHEMWVRLTVDDGMQVRAVEVTTDASPFEVCPAIAPDFQRLVGLRIASGWTQAVKERLGGVKGCTHLVELLGPVATTAFQTIYPYLSRLAPERPPGAETAPRRRPPLLDTCHAFASDGPVVKQRWPEFYTGPGSGADPAPAPAEPPADAPAGKDRDASPPPVAAAGSRR